MMSRALHYNRGNVHVATGDHGGAVKDFDTALQHGYKPKIDVLCKRGNSKFALEIFKKAHEDFKAAWFEQRRSDAALAMGNCKVMIGAFEEALQRYVSGSVVEPESSDAHCRQNAEQVQHLLSTLQGSDYRVRREQSIVFVETAGTRGNFRFAGNRGNTGNVPSGMISASGGKGYGGLEGFTVIIVSPTP